jgi:peptidoglycan-associated lipoprotein
MRKIFQLFMVGAVILFFQGCAPKSVSMPPSEQVSKGAGVGQPGLTEGSQKGGGAVTEEDLTKAGGERGRAATEAAANAERLQDIYFEFDNYMVRSEDMPVLRQLAALLNANQTMKLTIEGHCDERGTTEYNLALGQRRAEAAKDYLVKLGVDEKRIKSISYGKEAPIQPGHTEADWAKNRRDHFAVQ